MSKNAGIPTQTNEGAGMFAGGVGGMPVGQRNFTNALGGAGGAMAMPNAGVPGMPQQPNIFATQAARQAAPGGMAGFNMQPEFTQAAPGGMAGANMQQGAFMPPMANPAEFAQPMGPGGMAGALAGLQAPMAPKVDPRFPDMGAQQPNIMQGSFNGKVDPRLSGTPQAQAAPWWGGNR